MPNKNATYKQLIKFYPPEIATAICKLLDSKDCEELRDSILKLLAKEQLLLPAEGKILLVWITDFENEPNHETDLAVLCEKIHDYDLKALADLLRQLLDQQVITVPDIKAVAFEMR